MDLNKLNFININKDHNDLLIYNPNKPAEAKILVNGSNDTDTVTFDNVFKITTNELFTLNLERINADVSSNQCVNMKGFITLDESERIDRCNVLNCRVDCNVFENSTMLDDVLNVHYWLFMFNMSSAVGVYTINYTVPGSGINDNSESDYETPPINRTSVVLVLVFFIGFVFAICSKMRRKHEEINNGEDQVLHPISINDSDEEDEVEKGTFVNNT